MRRRLRNPWPSCPTRAIRGALGALVALGLILVPAIGAQQTGGGVRPVPGVASAPQTLTRPALGVTSADGLVLENPTAATAGVPVQQSPQLRLRSQVWNTTAVAATNTNDWVLEAVPVSGATPSGLLKFGSALNGAATTFPLTLDSAGGLTLGGAGRLTPGGAGQLNVVNAAGTIGSALNVSGLPTIASGFGTAPAITAGSTPLAGSVGVGTGGVATSGTIAFSGTAFPFAPFCVVTPSLTSGNLRASATTTTLAIVSSVAFTASDVVSWICVGSR